MSIRVRFPPFAVPREVRSRPDIPGPIQPGPTIRRIQSLPVTVRRPRDPGPIAAPVIGIYSLSPLARLASSPHALRRVFDTSNLRVMAPGPHAVACDRW